MREDRVERSNGAIGIDGVVDKDDYTIVFALDGERESPWTGKNRPRHACLGCTLKTGIIPGRSGVATPPWGRRNLS